MDQRQNASASVFDAPLAIGGNSTSREPQIWADLAGALRGRYLLLIFLMLIAGAAGGALGWKHGSRQYRGEGIVVVSNNMPNVPDALRSTDSSPERFILAESALISERPIVEKAMASDIWQSANIPGKPNTVDAFTQDLYVDHPVDGETLHIYFTTGNAVSAGAGIQAVVHAYEADFAKRQEQLAKNDRTALENEKADLTKRLDVDDEQIKKFVTEHGTANLGVIEVTLQQVWQEYEKRVTELKSALVLAGSSASPSDKIANLTPMQIYFTDSTGGMARLINALDNCQDRLTECVGLGPTNPSVVAAQAALNEAKKRVEDYADSYRTAQLQSLTSSGVAANQDVGASIMQNADAIQENEKKFEKLADDAKVEWTKLGNEKLDADKVIEDRTSVMSQIQDIDRQMLQTSLANQLKGTLSVDTYGDSPAAFYKDNHIPWAAVGAVGAMSVPFVLIAGIGLRKKRYRYSDEADVPEPGRPPLLGILPVIPKKSTDPEQASIVAHCVHQIRVTIQIANSTGKHSAYMLTSGTPGDGKTSLTIALGMSFASSGSRTLLIDGDMIGSALSHRLAAPTRKGMASPLIIGALNSSVQRTRTPNLFLLPLPDDAKNEPGDLSPQAVRNLLKQARTLFDVILVDTGPALGSIEASIIANAVDGVILTISRGQNRELVNRALRHLRTSGANIIGMVFNRAEKRDFQRSVASQSLRSSPRLTPEGLSLPELRSELERIGPVAACISASNQENDAESGQGQS